MSRVVLAVDGNSLVHRSYHAASSTGLRDVDGRPCWAVRGLLTQLIAAVERIGPDALVVGFDDPVRSWRREKWPHYKAHRGEKLDSLVAQLDLAVELLSALGITVVVPDGLEADDVLASVAASATPADTTVIMTSDRDAFALIDDHTHVLRIINGGVECSPLISADRLVLLLGIRPEQYADYAALRGDPSDNLPGVRGFGPKTAARLLTEVETAAAAFDNPARAAALGPGMVARLTDPDARSAWEHNREIMAARRDIRIALDGRWPLDPDIVRSACAALKLTWTAADAVRVLCGSSTSSSPPADRRAAWDTVPATVTSWVRRPPPLARPTTAQLALF